jgi:hypothetical protein
MSRTRSRLAVALLCVLTLGVGALAWAGWTSAAHGSAGARTTTVPAPVAPTASAVAGGADASWTAVRVGATTATGYAVVRRHVESGTTVPATGGCAGIVTTTTCRDSAIEPGTWTFAVRALLGPWTGPLSPASGPVVVAGEVEASVDLTPRRLSPGDAVAVSGAGWGADQEVRIEVGPGRPACTLTASDEGGLDGSCTLPDRAAGVHAVRAVGGVTVADGGTVTVVPVLRDVTPAVTAGGGLTVRARGFAGSSRLTARLGDHALGTLTSNADGETGGSTLTVPAAVAPGSYALEVTDATGLRATAAVEVVTASLQLSPSAAAPGDSVDVTGSAWPVSAGQLQLHVGTTFMCGLTPDAAGDVSGTCTVPDTPGGVRPVRATNGAATAVHELDVLATVATGTPSTTAGAPLRLTGRGYAGPGQAVTATVGGVAVTLPAGTQVEANGRVSAEVTVPDLAAGTHVVRLVDATGRAATTTVEVLAPSLELSVPSGPPGTAVQATGARWPAGVWLNVRWGSAGSGSCNLQTRADGTFGPIPCTVPTQPGGLYDLHVDGGGAQVVVPGAFTITGRASVTPARAAAGQAITIEASGLAAASEVLVRIGDVDVATARSTASGTIGNVAATVPALDPGSHEVRVTDAVGGTAVTPITVYAPTLVSSTTTGSPGGTFRVSGQDWPARSWVGVSVGGAYACEALTDAAGTFTSQVCNVPTLAGGPQTLRAASGALQVVVPGGFTITGRLTTSLTRAAVGQTVTLDAAGMTRAADLVFRLGGTQVATARADSSGQARVSAVVPALAPGRHQVEVTDGTSTATTEIIVHAPTLTVTPGSGPAGTSVQFSGSGWPANTWISFGWVGSATCEALSDAAGAFGPRSCTVPARPSGTYDLRASGGGVQIVSVGAFTITESATGASASGARAVQGDDAAREVLPLGTAPAGVGQHGRESGLVGPRPDRLGQVDVGVRGRRDRARDGR